MSVFPGAIPPTGSASASDTLAAAGHTALHNAHSNEVNALATKIGTGASTPASGLLLRGNGAGTSAWGQANLTSDVTGVLPQANGGTGQTGATGSGVPVYQTSPTIITPTIASFVNANHDHTNAVGGGVLGTSALLANSVTKGSAVINTIATAQTVNAADGFVTVTNASGSFTSQNGGDLLLVATFDTFKATNTGQIFMKITIGATNVPNATGWSFFHNALLDHRSMSFSSVVSGIAAGTYTVNMQISTGTDSVKTDTNSQMICTIVELKK